MSTEPEKLSETPKAKRGAMKTVRHLGHMFRVIARSLRQYKKDAIWALVLSGLQAAAECCLPLVMSILIAKLQNLQAAGTTTPADIMPIVGIYAAILVALAVVSFVTSFFGAKASARAAVGLAANLKQDLFYQTTRFSFENIDRFSKASLVTRQTTDVFNIQNAFMMMVRFCVLAPFNMIFSIALTFVVGWQLAWVYAISVPIIIIALVILMTIATRTYAKAFPKFDDINKVVEENVRGIRTVKSYTREPHEKSKFRNRAEEIRHLMTKGEIAAGLTNPVLSCTINITVAMFVGFGATAMADRVINAGQFNALINYGVNVLMSLMMLSMIFVMIAMSFVSCQRVCEVLEEQPAITSAPDGVKEVADGSIVYEGVHFAFTDEKAQVANAEECLKGIDLSIASGEVVGVIGGTGSSKSTLVNMLPRFYDPQQGSVRVGGVDVRNYDLTALRDGVSMVLQKNVLFAGTLRENMQWGKEDATDEEIFRALDIASATEFVDQLPGKLDYMVDQGGANFSGGQKQRLCIARAILKSPKVLIFDDSTSAVDTKTDARIREALRNLLPGVTKIIVAQRISSVADADRVIVMDDGRVESFDEPRKLYHTSKIFREVCDLQGVKEDQLR